MNLYNNPGGQRMSKVLICTPNVQSQHFAICLLFFGGGYNSLSYFKYQDEIFIIPSFVEDHICVKFSIS